MQYFLLQRDTCLDLSEIEGQADTCFTSLLNQLTLQPLLKNMLSCLGYQITECTPEENIGILKQTICFTNCQYTWFSGSAYASLYTASRNPENGPFEKRYLYFTTCNPL